MRKNLKRATLLGMAILVLVLAGAASPRAVLLTNARVLTVDKADRVVEAMLIQGNRIVSTGTNRDLIALAPPRTRVVDLQGLAVMPGFIDAHSHFPVGGLKSSGVDLSPWPIGPVKDRADLLQRIADAATRHRSGEWVLGFNYDNTSFDDGQHPDRDQLDAVAPDTPVYLWHSSGHMGVANSRALEKLGIEEDSVAPVGGRYGRDPAGTLNGLLQEKAAPPLGQLISEFPLQKKWQTLRSATDAYLVAGVTTVQNGYAAESMISVLQWSQRLGLLPQRVVVWPAHDKQPSMRYKQNPHAAPGSHDNPRFMVGAVKIIVDGSPQGLTAHLTKPYHTTLGQGPGYRGFSLYDLAALMSLVLDYHKRGYQLALHGNGDAAIDAILDAVAYAHQEHKSAVARHILVHAQTLREDQASRMRDLPITPSFFNAHTFYFGDWHRTRSLGDERARNISPAAWAQHNGVRFTLHTDAPVTPINPLQLIWSAVHRETSTGFVLGPGQRIDVAQAVRATTIDAAWQNRLDAQLGSLEPGKLADFIVLSDNPYSAADIRNIRVLNTVIAGKQHYRDAKSVVDLN